MSCRHVRDWLHRDASSLGEAQRLQLDDHLASCERCRGDREHMQTLRRVGTSLDTPASSRMYDRAIARALLEGRREVTPVRPRWMWPLVLGAAAAGAIVLVLALRGGKMAPLVSATKPVVPAPPPPRPESLVPPSEELPDLAGATAVIGDLARLVQGQVVFGAGAFVNAAAIEHDELLLADPHRTSPKLESVADVLSRARKELAARHYADAERTASSVIARASSGDEAEARTILADIAQASGNYELASERYRDVAARFASLPAGESALYAAARVEARRGHDARPLLETYLARYPRGRFVDDARRLLDTSTKEHR